MSNRDDNPHPSIHTSFAMFRFFDIEMNSIKYQLLISESFALLLIYPFAIKVQFGELMLDTLTNIVFLSALIAVRRHPKVLHIAIVLLCPVIVLTWWPWFPDVVNQEIVTTSLTVIYVAYVTWHIFVEVFNQPKVGRDTLFGAICVYLLIGLLWSYIYQLSVLISPGAINVQSLQSVSDGELAANLLYFSYTTLTTVGYGDITPVSLFTRSIATVEQIIGVFYIAIMISRLVSMHPNSGDRGQ